MIEQITSFRSSDKSTHDTEYAAWQRELQLWLRAHGIDNEAIAASVVRRVVDAQPGSLEALKAIAEGLSLSAPKQKVPRRRKANTPQLAAVA